MKNQLLLLAGAILLNSMAIAAPVSKNQAATVALNFLEKQKGASRTLQAKTVSAISDELYLVNFAPQGFAIVAADDTSDPIIGYSTSGSLNASSLPENMAFMMEEASKGVEYVRSNNTHANKFWNDYSNGVVVRSRAGGERVEDLIQVKFDQGSPFNKYTPGTGSKKTLVGCVAVAMAQAMTVQRYPVKPMGQHSYRCEDYGSISIDYDKEAPYDWDAIISGANNKDEAARLMYHTGVSVSMGYGTEGSGIPSNQVYRITEALKEYFGYGSDVKYTWRDNYRGDWEQLLLNELYADRAVIYNAVDTKGSYGHSFNIDGYDGNGKFHVNWGWGGIGNGYFSINALSDRNMNMNYDAGHVVVTGIGASNSAFRNIELSDLYVEENKPAGTFVGVLLVNGDVVDDATMSVALSGQYNVATGSYDDVPFEYKDGQIVTTKPLTVADGTVYTRITVTMKDGSSARLRQGFSIRVEEHKPLESRTALRYDRTTKTFTLHARYGSTVKLTNASGAEVTMTKHSILPEYTFSRESLSAGVNTIEMTFEGETKQIKIKK